MDDGADDLVKVERRLDCDRRLASILAKSHGIGPPGATGERARNLLQLRNTTE